jgi:hypothetical protein
MKRSEMWKETGRGKIKTKIKFKRVKSIQKWQNRCMRSKYLDLCNMCLERKHDISCESVQVQIEGV